MNIHPESDWARLLRVLLLLLLPAGVRAQCALVCASELQVSLPETGQMVVAPEIIAPAAAQACPGELSLTLWRSPGVAIPDNTITCDHVELTLTAQVQHIATGNYCTVRLHVQDYLPPVLHCPEIWLNCTDQTAPDAAGYPEMNDNCTPESLLSPQYADLNTSLPCGTVEQNIAVLGKITRHWTVTDQHDNTASCQQTLWIKKASLDSLIFPVARDGIAAPALSCGQSPDDLNLSGTPMLFGYALAAGQNTCNIGYTFSDQRINGCTPGAYTILRNWIAIDQCTNALKTFAQIIKVEDHTPPVIQAPANLTLSTEDTECRGVVNLPAPTVVDACSTVSVTAQWAFGVGYGPFTNVPEGTHLVTYTAQDACGNTATATSSVTVEDQNPPQVICLTTLQISLSANGQALVNVNAIDAGSWDNCGVIFRAVSRDGANWGNTAALSCADEGMPVPVTLRVMDASGYTNYCQVPITVRDYLPPQITCPPAVTLACTDDDTDPALAGAATVTDNCGTPNVTWENISVPLSACQIGTITRRWTATDHAGNVKNCQQMIQKLPIGAISVQFPPDITLNDCPNEAQLDPSATGTPIPEGAGCFPLSVTRTDEWFDGDNTACFRILRHWKVVDPCIYNGNGTAGLWEHFQQITVSDQSPPVMTLPDDVVAASAPDTCGAWIQLPAVTSSDCGGAVEVLHDSPYSPPGNTINGWYPQGSHRIVFTATNYCGLQTRDTMQIEVTCIERFTIEGDLKNRRGQPMADIRVTDGQGHWVLSDTAGHYRFEHLEAGKDYVIRPVHGGDWTEGVDAWDLVLMSRHILNLTPLDSPEKLIASDANRSKTLTTFDIVQLRKVLLGALPAVPEGVSWRFVPSAQVWDNPEVPFDPPPPDFIAVPGLQGHQTGLDFTGIKCGDVD